jgi:hypothetical protein
VTTPEFALSGMFDGTADRPHDYRQLPTESSERCTAALGIAEALLSDDKPYHHQIAWFYAGATDARKPMMRAPECLIIAACVRWETSDSASRRPFQVPSSRAVRYSPRLHFANSRQLDGFVLSALYRFGAAL